MRRRVIAMLKRRLSGTFVPRGRDGFGVAPLRQGLDFGAVAELADLPVTEFERAPGADQLAIARRVLRSRLYPPRC